MVIPDFPFIASGFPVDFRLGVVLYDGEDTMPLGDRPWAAPLSTLWGK